MQVHVEPTLLERTVFHATRVDDLLADEYQRAFAGCYREAPGERRDQAFVELHERWFERLGLRARVTDRLSEFPNIASRVSRFALVDARARTRSGAELFGKDGRFALVLAVTPALLLHIPVFDAFARFELQHIEDMLDPDFGYDLSRKPGGTNAAAANLAHDRFVILWAMSVDARIHHVASSADQSRQTRYREFVRAFRAPDTDAIQSAFQQQWVQLGRARPTHAQLIEWAENGIPGLRQDRYGCTEEGLPTPGARCPLCGFPTFDWAENTGRSEFLIETIQQDFPTWTPQQPICRRCEEVYRDRARRASVGASVLSDSVGTSRASCNAQGVRDVSSVH